MNFNEYLHSNLKTNDFISKQLFLEKVSKKEKEDVLNHFDGLIGGEFEVSFKDDNTDNFVKDLKSLGKIEQFSQYHGGKTSKNWHTEPDSSITGKYGIELISPPIKLKTFLDNMQTIFKAINKFGTTNKSTGLHIGISLKNIKSIDILKLVLFMEEGKIYKFFKERKNNKYAKSMILEILQKLEKGKDIIKKDYTEFLGDLESFVPKEKYYGINFMKLNSANPYLEFRYLGGTNYHKKFTETKFQILDFIYFVQLAIDPEFKKKEYILKINRLLNSLLDNTKNLDRIKVFKFNDKVIGNKLMKEMLLSKVGGNWILKPDVVYRDLEINITKNRDLEIIGGELISGNYSPSLIENCLLDGIQIDSGIVKNIKFKFNEKIIYLARGVIYEDYICKNLVIFTKSSKEDIQIQDGELWGLLDKNSKVILEPKYDFIDAPDSNGTRVIKVNGKVGLLDKNYKVILEPIYDYIGPPDEDGIRVIELNRKYGLLDKNLKVVVELKYDYIGPPTKDEDGIRVIILNDKKGILDKNLKVVVEPKYDAIRNLNLDGTRVIDLNGKVGLLDKDYKVVVEPKYDILNTPKKDGTRAINLNGKKGLLDKDFKVVVEPKYDFIDGPDSNGTRVINLNGKKGLLDKDYKVILEPKYDAIWNPHDDGTRTFALNKKEGILDKDYKVVLEPIYDRIGNSNEDGTRVIKLNGKVGLLDKNFKVILEPKYDIIRYLNKDGTRVINLNGKKGLLDKNFKITWEEN